MERAVARREIRRIDMSLKLFRISQTVNKDYDTYDLAVVVAENEDDARRIHPDGRGLKWVDVGDWCSPEHVAVEFVGIPDELFKAGDVVCASFNAG